jgi:hypothetical protein
MRPRIEIKEIDNRLQRAFAKHFWVLMCVLLLLIVILGWRD